MHHLSLVWLRRNLRLEDNKVLASAVNNSHKIQPIFIFDASILEQPNASNTRRLSFLMDALIGLNHRLNKKDGKILVFYGDAKVIIPKVVRLLKTDAVYADEEFEPAKIKRDKLIHEQLQGDCEFKLICDHLLFHPAHILNKEGKPFKIFTPYMKAFRARLSDEVICKFNYKFENKLLLDNEVASNEYYQVVDITLGSKLALEQIGHNYQKNLLWPVDEGKKRLENFIYKKLHKYEYARNFLAQDGTSSLSPYLRFGLISIRECYRLALEEENAQKWLSELIWKEFYATILYHFPYTQNLEFQVKFQGTLPWNSDPELLAKFCTGQTGFPIIDAAVRQLLLEGWMHNRARLIVASFFTKNLFLNWRLGEKFFAQHLIDYDLASNVGGWQWASSCGTDPQPFFRIFNPITQGLKFDPDAKYIKEYVQELKSVPVKLIHNQKAVVNNFAGKYNYFPPIVNYQESRANSLAIFRSAKSALLITQIV